MANPPENYLVLGEGDRDSAFIKTLCEVRGIGPYSIEHVKGNAKFGSYLDGLRAQPRFKSLRGILLVSDNDETSQKSFTLVKQQLNDADFPSPPRPLEIARKKDMPPLAIVMMPYPAINGDETGCLETLVIPALDSTHPRQAACVDTLMQCVEANTWAKRGSIDKAKVRCILSTVWNDDPNHGFTYCLSQHKGLIPLNHSIFDGFATLLGDLPAWFDSPMAKWSEWESVRTKFSA